MKMKKNLLITFIMGFFLSVCSGYGQLLKKNTEAIRITTPPIIDGNLTDECWAKIKPASEFVVCVPNSGSRPKFWTDFKVAFDDVGLYIGAFMYDPHPDSILHEIGKRDDQNVNADCFTFCINPYNDGLNEFAFRVTAAGIQIDKKNKGPVEDLTWDAVWESSVSIQEEGWIVEMKIPFSAIRLPKTDGRLWGLNCWRNIRRYQEWSTWNFVDINSNEWINQSGELSGLKDINPPMRLTLIPYLSAYYEHYPYETEDLNNSTYLLNGGLDLKAGLNESFTLDLTLIPDFGQVQSDNKVLNLTPFEIKYDEKRPFFMEGTELFNTAGLFYSRRIGGIPVNYYSANSKLAEDERMLENPSATRILNAFKLSGRSGSGFGMGVFNATTSNTFAKTIDERGNNRTILTQPWTNYNIIVGSYSLNKTSFISLINTNVYYGNRSNLANVTGFDLKIADSKNMWGISSTGALSQKFDSKNTNPDFGGKWNVALGKINGKFQFSLLNKLMTSKFNPGDMGYISNNNFMESGIKLNYNIFQPFGIFNSIQNEVNFTSNRLFEPFVHTGLIIRGFSVAEFKNTSSLLINIASNLVSTRDYYEPRIPGRFYNKKALNNIEVMISSDSRKAVQVNAYGGMSLQGRTDNHLAQMFWMGFSPRYRLNNKSSLSYSFKYNKGLNLLGFAAADSIIRFGQSVLPEILHLI
jgi:hypothetical protein